jgi:hypothetical protein
MVERSRRRREMKDMATTRMILTTAVLAAVAALMTAPAHAYFADVDGGGSSNEASVPTQTLGLDPAIQTAIEARQASVPQPIPYLSHGMGVDQTLFGAQGSGDTDESRYAGDVAAGQSVETVPTIPYLSHGIGVDQTLFGAQPSGDVDESRFAGDVARASAIEPSQSSSGTTDVDWTWIGVGSGLAAFLALAMASLFLTARQRRGDVALP